jgi:hypothetical protein
MCGPSSPFSHLEPVRLIHLGSSPLLFRYPGLTDSDWPAAFFGSSDSGLGLSRTVIMSTLLHPVPDAGLGNKDVFFSSLSHNFLEFFSNLNPRRFGRGAVL